MRMIHFLLSINLESEEAKMVVPKRRQAKNVIEEDERT
jgi:dimeric dUTPase (all-alpha-NTP-PPase superfamily)